MICLCSKSYVVSHDTRKEVTNILTNGHIQVAAVVVVAVCME